MDADEIRADAARSLEWSRTPVMMACLLFVIVGTVVALAVARG